MGGAPFFVIGSYTQLDLIVAIDQMEPMVGFCIDHNIHPIHQKSGIVFVLVHLVQQFVMGSKAFMGGAPFFVIGSYTQLDLIVAIDQMEPMVGFCIDHNIHPQRA